MMMMKNLVFGSALTVTLLLDGAYCITPQKLRTAQQGTLQSLSDVRSESENAKTNAESVMDVRSLSIPTAVSVSMLVDSATNPTPGSGRQGNYVLIDPDSSPLTPSNAVSDVQYARFRNMTLLEIGCPYTGELARRCTEFEGQWFDVQLPNDLAGTHFYVNGPVVVANEAVLEINLNDPSPAPGQTLSPGLLSQFPRSLPISQDSQTSYAISVGFQRSDTLPGNAHWVWARWEAPQLVNCEDGQTPGQQDCQILAPAEIQPDNVDEAINLLGYYESKEACQNIPENCFRACVYLSTDESEKGKYKADYYYGSLEQVPDGLQSVHGFVFNIQTNNEALRQFNFQHGSDALGAYGNATLVSAPSQVPMNVIRSEWPIERNHLNNTIVGMYMDLFMTAPLYTRDETKDCDKCGKLAGVCPA